MFVFDWIRFEPSHQPPPNEIYDASPAYPLTKLPTVRQQVAADTVDVALGEQVEDELFEHAGLAVDARGYVLGAVVWEIVGEETLELVRRNDFGKPGPTCVVV